MKSHPLFATTVISLALVFAMVTPPFVHADDDRRIRQLLRNGEILSLEKIFDAARIIKPGRILDVELEEDDGRIVYEIELLDARGRVWEMEFDARTGSLLDLEEDD